MEPSTISQQTLLNCISVSGLSLLTQKYQEQNNLEQTEKDLSYHHQGIFIMYSYGAGILLGIGSRLFQLDILEHISDAIVSGTCLRVVLQIGNIFCEQYRNEELQIIQKKQSIRITLLLIGLRSYNIRRSLRVIVGYSINKFNISKELSRIIDNIESSYTLFPEERWLTIKNNIGYNTRTSVNKGIEYSILSLLLILRTRWMREATRIHYIFVGSGIVLFLFKCYSQRKQLPPVPYIHEINFIQ